MQILGYQHLSFWQANNLITHAGPTDMQVTQCNRETEPADHTADF